MSGQKKTTRHCNLPDVIKKTVRFVRDGDRVKIETAPSGPLPPRGRPEPGKEPRTPIKSVTPLPHSALLLDNDGYVWELFIQPDNGKKVFTLITK